MNYEKSSQLMLLIAAVVVCGVIFYNTTQQSTNQAFGFIYKGENVSARHAGLTGMFVCIGIILALVVEYLLQRDKKYTTLQFILNIRTALALIAAPVVTVFVFDQVYDKSEDFHAYVVALQNGFFFRVLLASILQGSTIRSD